ncbi:PadR family transcriptional regulator [Cryobacterium sp. SO1]|uniref:PadR family transcriptional regulator n=1 Tax=Cryobacterium sp. SO1 TaxID=1897061 RepID=UPI0010239B1D|nr:PadR family transcriptional regulator [Cryobacterium sp. SO1]RZI36487.1 hypothetical protein BJQ95_01104 [Cryobacterium sp. SO1]
MTVRQTLLSILSLEPCYGHQLRAEFVRRTGGVWPINIGQIHTTLDRLERDGLVQKGNTDSLGRAYFSILDAGRDVVNDWLSIPSVKPQFERNELVMKLAVASTLPGVDVSEVISAQRGASLTALQNATRSREHVLRPTSPEDVAFLMIADSAIEHAAAEIRWLDLAEQRLSEATAGGFMTALPVTSTTPGRGRPANSRSGQPS